jgi:hypothetical protein
MLSSWPRTAIFRLPERARTEGVRVSDSVVVSVIPPCDFCDPVQNGRPVPAVVDGKTTHGPWANMCQDHFDMIGVGLGTGKGQRLVLQGVYRGDGAYPCPIDECDLAPQDFVKNEVESGF